MSTPQETLSKQVMGSSLLLDVTKQKGLGGGGWCVKRFTLSQSMSCSGS